MNDAGIGACSPCGRCRGRRENDNGRRGEDARLGASESWGRGGDSENLGAGRNWAQGSWTRASGSTSSIEVVNLATPWGGPTDDAALA
jgi:hypothetical protein